MADKIQTEIQDDQYYQVGKHRLLELRRIKKEGESKFEIAQLYSDEALPEPDDTEHKFNITSKVSMLLTKEEFTLLLVKGFKFIEDERDNKEEE